jgi:hypothetical protein
MRLPIGSSVLPLAILMGGNDLCTSSTGTVTGVAEQATSEHFQRVGKLRLDLLPTHLRDG